MELATNEEIQEANKLIHEFTYGKSVDGMGYVSDFNNDWGRQIAAWQKAYAAFQILLVKGKLTESQIKEFTMLCEQYYRCVNVKSPKGAFPVLLKAIKWHSTNTPSK